MNRPPRPTKECRYTQSVPTCLCLSSSSFRQHETFARGLLMQPVQRGLSTSAIVREDALSRLQSTTDCSCNWKLCDFESPLPLCWCRVDAHGYNHNLQVYRQAVEKPSQGNIMRIPMNSRELHGLVSGGRRQELHGTLLISI